MLPHFIIAGASKAGSTWLSRCLGEHPQVFTPHHTAEYFSYRYDRGQAWYESLFESAGGKPVIGEKSTSYIIWDGVPQRMAGCVPHVQLFFVLREPISRANSHYRMLLRSGHVGEDIDDVLVPGHPLVEEGRYFTQLNRFREHFQDAQLHVYLYDQMRDDPVGLLHDVFSVLNVDPDFKPSLLGERYHVTKTRPRFQGAYNAAVRTVRFLTLHSRWLGQGLDSMRQRGVFDVFHRLNRGDAFPEMSREHRRKLAEYYQDDIEALGRWLGQDLSHWVEPHLNDVHT